MTKDEWAAFSARPAHHPVCGVVAVGSNSLTRLPTPSIVAPPAFPELALAVPVEVAGQIDALTRNALDVAGLVDLPAFDELATETTFGPDAGRLVKAGLSRPLAASVARWGSALYHLGSRLPDARTAGQWHAEKYRRAIERRKEIDAANLVYVRKVAGQWGGAAVHQGWRDDIATRADIAPPERDGNATHSRLVAYQIEGRLRHLLSTGGLPCRMAVALAASFDGAGWSETACMLTNEMTGAAMTAIAPGAFAAGPKHRRATSGLAKGEATERARLESWIAGVAHYAVRWAEQTWRTTEGPPTGPRYKRAAADLLALVDGR